MSGREFTKHEAMEEFAKLGRSLSRAKSIPEAGRTILEAANRLIGWDSAYINTFLPDRSALETVYAVDTVDGKQITSKPAVYHENVDSWIARVIPGGPRLVDTEEEARECGLAQFGSGKPSQSRLFAPVSTEDAEIGAISIQSYKKNAYAEDDLHLLAALADHCAGAFERVLAESELRRLNRDLETRVALRTAELRDTNDQLSRATRLKDEFLASMSHELRTPLNSVLGLAEAMREGVYGELTRKQLKPLARIEESGRHLLELINDILDLSKIEAGKLDLNFEDFPIADVARQTVRFVQQQATRKGLNVTCQIDPQAESVYGDSRRIKQILINLLTNALKFTPSGGTIGLKVLADDPPGSLSMTVHDTGIGISEEQQRLLFKPFVQLDGALTREHAGTGLGLALVKRLIELHDGGVSVSSKEGEGSRFTIRMPWKRSTRDHTPYTEPDLQELETSTRLPPEDLSAGAGSCQTMRLVRDVLGNRGWHFHYSATDGDIIRIDGDQRPDLIVFDASSMTESLARLVGRIGKVTALSGIPALYIGPTETIDNSTLAELAVLEADEPNSRVEALVDDLVDESAGRNVLVLTAGTEHKIRVLVAEDNQIIQSSLTEYLRAKGCEVKAASDGVTALRAALDWLPDIILLDIQMPKLTGLEVLHQLRASDATRDTPVIALTALAMPGDRERCLAAGATDYLAKPVSLSGLSEKVRQFARERLATGRE